MGYYTRHSLEIEFGDDYNTNYAKEISQLADYDDCFSDSIKWYDHEKDMRSYSKKHPQTLFKLSGEGEESGDLWIEYYMDGKMQRTEVKLVYDEYDQTKLA